MQVRTQTKSFLLLLVAGCLVGLGFLFSCCLNLSLSDLRNHHHDDEFKRKSFLHRECCFRCLRGSFRQHVTSIAPEPWTD